MANDRAPPAPDTFRLAVKVTPSASKNMLVGFHGEELAVKIAAPPDKGKANRELIAFLSKTLGVAKSAIVLRRGETSPHKLLELPVACRGALARLIGRP